MNEDDFTMDKRYHFRFQFQLKYEEILKKMAALVGTNVCKPFEETILCKETFQKPSGYLP